MRRSVANHGQQRTHNVARPLVFVRTTSAHVVNHNKRNVRRRYACLHIFVLCVEFDFSTCCSSKRSTVVRIHIVCDRGQVVNYISRHRPYHAEYAGSRPIPEAKQHWARSVLGRETTWEHRVLMAPFFCHFDCVRCLSSFLFFFFF